uniref:RING-CH-type domain-containing protein n=1 Tax=Wuchereria bancrofti TaxID=6293 RepID=A0AAF5PYC5_WUCBA
MGSSNISVSFVICRICRSGKQSIAYDNSTANEPLISPCFCRGTIGLCHRSCLERWLASSNRSACEICHFTYQTVRRYRTFCEFMGNTDSYLQRRNLITDIACFVFFTPIVICCIILCLSLAAQTKGFGLRNNFAGFQATSLLILSVSLSMIYFIWLIIVIIFHIKTYLDWRVLNKEVLVVDQESTCNSWKTINRVRRRRERPRMYAMRLLLCFDLHSILRNLCRKNVSVPSASNANSDNSNSAISVVSSNALNMNYDDFVHHLHPEDGEIPVIGLCQHTMASTPVPNDKAFAPPQIFEYPSVNSHFARFNNTVA